MNEQEKINADVRYERTDASAKWLGAIGASIVVAAIVLPFVLWGLYGYLEQTAARGAPESEAVSRQRFDRFGAPQLEPQPVKNYQEFRRAENEKLNNYGWIDREKGAVHIPIKQAMKILVEKGLPDVSNSAAVNNQSNANAANANFASSQTMKNQPTNSANENLIKR